MHASNLFFIFFFFFVLVFFLAFPLTTSQPFDYPSANFSMLNRPRWTNDHSFRHSVTYPDGSIIRPILLRGAGGPSFAFGFYCSSPCSSFLLAVVLVSTNIFSTIINLDLAPPHVVWSPNRSRPVGANSTLLSGSDGLLCLYDSDSSLVWSTDIAITAINLTEAGNLVMLNGSTVPVWQSFEDPTDTLLVGQSLVVGQRLTANVSATNSSESQIFLTMTNHGLYAYVDSNPPQMYFQWSFINTASLTYMNGSLVVFSHLGRSGILPRMIALPLVPHMQYMRLENDGHLRVYAWDDSTGWRSTVSVFDIYLDDCNYPTVCGAYGICSNGQQCSCPATNFEQIDGRQPNLGCMATTPLSCESIKEHQLLLLSNVSYFNYVDTSAALPLWKTEDLCKLACLANCSCKAAFYRHGDNVSSGACYLLPQVFSMINDRPEITHYNSSAYVKVQITPEASPSSSAKGSSIIGGILGPVLGSMLPALLVVGVGIYVWRKRRVTDEEEEDQFDQVPGMPTRFSFQELMLATANFSTKLGQGGFGSVFAGMLTDGTRVAVKRLDGVGQGKNEFLAEVHTIGSIHHINVVRLIGFCAERTHRLLVYEFMCNGSLDKWIFHSNNEGSLDWQTRHKIITDIAKGLSYLHEQCRQRIAHLDIKPQNILLDDEFNAKVADFGLSKLIDRDQSEVMTRMRGTIGYLAPEWLTSIITEKADVYSFGVVIVEIVCGRKNLDYSQPKERVHLISQLRRLIEVNRLADLVDNNSEDMMLHIEEVVEIMMLACWCLQSETNRRPSMSTVVKVLEGSLEVQQNLDFDFASPTLPISLGVAQFSGFSPVLESSLSGPR